MNKNTLNFTTGGSISFPLEDQTFSTRRASDDHIIRFLCKQLDRLLSTVPLRVASSVGKTRLECGTPGQNQLPGVALVCGRTPEKNMGNHHAHDDNNDDMGPETLDLGPGPGTWDLGHETRVRRGRRPEAWGLRRGGLLGPYS